VTAVDVRQGAAIAVVIVSAGPAATEAAAIGVPAVTGGWKARRRLIWIN
jgi:hypothetical protein